MNPPYLSYPADPQEIYLKTQWLRLAARQWGHSPYPPVLALHGWLDNAASFDRLAPFLPDVHLVALDLPGHGFSQWRPAGTHYHVIDFVADAWMAANALEWPRFSLMGHSLGAGIASFLAATVPERIDRLILIEGIGPLSGDAAQAPAQLALSMEQTVRLAHKRLPLYDAVEEAIAARQRVGGLSTEAATILAQRGLKRVEEGWMWRTDPMLTVKSPIYLTEEQILGFMAAIRAPTLLIQGTSGYLIPRTQVPGRVALVANIQVKTLPGGHHLHLDDPAPVARLIRDFLTI